MGPVWAGGALAFKTFYILLSVPLGLLLFVAVSNKKPYSSLHCFVGVNYLVVDSILFSSLQVLVILSFKRLKEPKSTTSVLLP